MKIQSLFLATIGTLIASGVILACAESALSARVPRHVPPGRNPGSGTGPTVGGGTRYAGEPKSTGKEVVAKKAPRKAPKVDGSRGCNVRNIV